MNEYGNKYQVADIILLCTKCVLEIIDSFLILMSLRSTEITWKLLK